MKARAMLRTPSGPTLARYASRVALASGAYWIACAKLNAPPILFWPGVVAALLSSTAYIIIFVMYRQWGRRTPTDGSQTHQPTPEDTGLELRWFAVMICVLGVTSSIAALRLERWIVSIPFLLIALSGWGASIVLWVRHEWAASAR